MRALEDLSTKIQPNGMDSVEVTISQREKFSEEQVTSLANLLANLPYIESISPPHIAPYICVTDPGDEIEENHFLGLEQKLFTFELKGRGVNDEAILQELSNARQYIDMIGDWDLAMSNMIKVSRQGKTIQSLIDNASLAAQEHYKDSLEVALNQTIEKYSQLLPKGKGEAVKAAIMDWVQELYSDFVEFGIPPEDAQIDKETTEALMYSIVKQYITDQSENVLNLVAGDLSDALLAQLSPQQSIHKGI